MYDSQLSIKLLLLLLLLYLYGYGPLLYAGAHFGAYYCMDIHIWYSGVYHMDLRDHAVFFRNLSKMQVECLIIILTIQW